MRILANENFPGDAVKALRARGHDVVWIRTEAPGSKDQNVLERASIENRILVTFDKDFGELAFRWKLPVSAGIILFRITAKSPEGLVRKVVDAIESRMDWPGNFAVIEESRIRMRSLPRVVDKL